MSSTRCSVSRNRQRGRSRTKRSGYRSASRSRSPNKKYRSRQGPDFLFEVGTLGAGLQSLRLDSERDTAYRNNTGHAYTQDFSADEYVQDVKWTFSHTPETYKRFIAILSEVEYSKNSTDKLEIIKKVITLFDGYPELILGFNMFLPSDYRIEIQDDIVIVKVYDSFGNIQDIDTGHIRPYPGVNGTQTTINDSDMSVNAPSYTLDYVSQVKQMCADKPQKYKQFSDVLKDFHSKKVDTVDTIHKMVTLFSNFPHLIVGFKAFLPPGFHIHLHSDSYDIEYPGHNDGEVTIAHFRK